MLTRKGSIRNAPTAPPLNVWKKKRKIRLIIPNQKKAQTKPAETQPSSHSILYSCRSPTGTCT
ncbi:hypothetical protein NC651_008017 [Populus alba x Populus x berolinensis]|nr:hypothetical protein NC651_008017 [Populus alba x Populus x berolinensis]